ncbi:MAG: enoyl-CoA hydratase [Marinosulfonomonas sp.]|nr:enoyl-CoA hydratase [Marinosulfonomonas sp.]
MSDILLRKDTGGIATLTMNSPSNLNALSDAMLAALKTQFDALAADTQTKVVILQGAGKVFCAGHDLKEMTRGRAAKDGGRAYFHDLFSRCASVMQSITALPQPVIAKAHGIATAAGCQLVATCDLAVAAQGTRFGVNGVNIGLFCSTPMVALTRNVPRKQAFEMLTTGAFIDADRAAEIGLINQAVEPDALDAAASDMAQTLARKMNGVLAIGKQAFYKQMQMGLADAYAYTGEVITTNMMMRDTEEGIAAFLEKRAPDWKA